MALFKANTVFLSSVTESLHPFRNSRSSLYSYCRKKKIRESQIFYIFFYSERERCGERSVHFILISLHHSVAEMTWPLEQSQAYQQSSSSEPWLLHTSSCNPAVCSETPKKNKSYLEVVCFTHDIHTDVNSLSVWTN